VVKKIKTNAREDGGKEESEYFFGLHKNHFCLFVLLAKTVYVE
jgi:hypothetical protein